MILHRVDHTRMIWPVPDRRFEDDALVVALALALGLDAVGAGRALFTALDATLAACEAASLRPLPHLRI